MPARRLKEFLNENNIRYTTIIHSLAYTAQEIAALTHIKGQEMAKTVMVKVDGKMAMVVVPATLQVDLDLLAAQLSVESVVLASEQEFTGLFPQCEVGAMPPFGNLYGLELFCAEELGEDEEIAFNAGTHTELIQMAWADYRRLAEPRLMKLAMAPVYA